MEGTDSPRNLKPTSSVLIDGKHTSAQPPAPDVFTNNSPSTSPSTNLGQFWSGPLNTPSPRFSRGSPSPSHSPSRRDPSSYSDSGGSYGDYLLRLLCRMCLINISHCPTVPISCRLKGVMKQGDAPQHTSRATELWKGVYNGQVVALKILRVHEGDPQVALVKSVRMLYNTFRFFCHYPNIWLSGFARK